jgi:hypothetical protein
VLSRVADVLSRHAISTLQIRLLSNTAESHLNPHHPQLPSLSREGDDKNLIGRDKSFSMLHGIGKLLHSRLGKRREERRERRERRGEERRGERGERGESPPEAIYNSLPLTESPTHGRLNFDPELVLER